MAAAFFGSLFDSAFCIGLYSPASYVFTEFTDPLIFSIQDKKVLGKALMHVIIKSRPHFFKQRLFE
jgi:hypothetical protein